MSENQDESARKEVEVSRRAYVPPQLVEYGNVAKLTETGGMTTIDFFFNLRRMR